MIDKHNEEHALGKHSFTMAMNPFGDMTNEEFRQVMDTLQKQKYETGEVFPVPSLAQTLPSVDWREKGSVTPVKNQGWCGSCWAFSATGALEGQMFRKTGRLVPLSEQNLVDCSGRQGNGGYRGGLVNFAFQYVTDNGGLDSEQSYPCHGKEEPCKYNPEYSAASVTGFHGISAQEKDREVTVANVGPSSVNIDASKQTFQFYKEGTYYDAKGSSQNPDPTVLVVGCGFKGAESHDNKHWIVKNSWITGWGMNGYVKIARDQNNHCGIASAAS
ncbi:hypothetical protein MC885_011259 [Smutsia gigantea]|nr:hypothetical protein MC885_011259 [Smutsia gigantea]